MQVYLVGGAVRDLVLGRKVTEHDYVVVGATPQQMLDLGFSQVGADFPVFLHPQTHDEYALARTERKSGSGYLGFSVYADPSVTLEDDLIRRDLTINAMAIEVNGLFDSTFKSGKFEVTHIIDPYHGLNDIEQKKLRHVSIAFAEDPVRVLRLARFASRYAPLGFTIDETTAMLIKQMHAESELNHLVAERVWSETSRALEQPWADVFFDSLFKLNVLGVILPTLYQKVINQPSAWQLSLLALRLAGSLHADNLIKFALLTSCFLTDKNQNHDFNDYSKFCSDLKIPKNHERFGLYFLQQFAALTNFDKLTSEQLFDLVKVSNILKDSTQLEQALKAVHIYHLAKQSSFINTIKNCLTQISAKDVSNDLQGKQIGEAIDNLRLLKLSEIMKSNNTI